MTDIPVFAPRHSSDWTKIDYNFVPIRVRVNWVLSERRRGLWVPVHKFHNLVTNYGLTALALASFGTFTPPIYLVIDTASTTMFATANSGTNTVQLTTDPTIAGDTQLVLSVGLAAQETVTFSSKLGSSPATFTLTANLANTHSSGDACVRAPAATDTMASVLSEAQFDPTNSPNMRSQLTAAFSGGTAQGTGQFFMPGATATNLYFAHVGLADQLTIGALNTNLHNYAALGYLHNNTNDLEIDVTYTLQTF